MSSIDNRFRNKWQDYAGRNATNAEHNFVNVFQTLFENTEYEIIAKPKLFSNIYVNVPLSLEEQKEIYNPQKAITKHGIQPDAMISNTKTHTHIFIEIKRQDGWVEGKPRSAGRGNAHERLCKYFTPGLLKVLKKESNIKRKSTYYPFWIVFQGDITRDPCRVREIELWFDKYKANYFFWRDTHNADSLVGHFEKYIVPLLS